MFNGAFILGMLDLRSIRTLYYTLARARTHTNSVFAGTNEGHFDEPSLEYIEFSVSFMAIILPWKQRSLDVSVMNKFLEFTRRLCGN